MFKLITKIILTAALTISASPLSWQTFSNGKISWLWSANDIYVFSADSKTIYPLVLDQSRTVGKISDIIEYEKTMLISTDAGIYQLDMSTQSIERIYFPDEKNKAGKIASDMDYVWLVTDNSLYRFDKLGREWQSYALPEKTQLQSILSDGVTVECLGKTSIYAFTITTEKWNKYTTGIELNDSTSILPFPKGDIGIYGKHLNIYKQNDHVWEQNSSDFPITDVVNDASNIYYCAGIHLMNLSGGVTRPIDIPNTSDIYAIGKSDFYLFIAMKNRIMKYNLTKSDFSFIEYPPELKKDIPLKITYNNYLIAIYEKNIAIYNNDSKSWTISNRTQQRSLAKVSWSEMGPMIQYKPGFYTIMKGYIESKTALNSAGFFYDTTFSRPVIKRDVAGNIMRDSNQLPIYIKDTLIDSTRLFSFKKPDFQADLNIHSTDPDGRILDFTFDNSNTLKPAKKIINFKGTQSDILNSLTGGSCQTDLMQSQLLTPVNYEGGQIILDSKSKLDDRDRKIGKLVAGGGFVTSRTVWKILKYRSDGNYYIGKDTNKVDQNSLISKIDLFHTIIKDTTQIIPSSVHIWVDGVELDQGYFAFYAQTSKLQIKPEAPIDPVSIINISYQVQPLPEGGNETVEFKPEHNFGKIYYGSTTFSPVNWLSYRVGTEAVDRDSIQPVIITAMPLEFRNTFPDLLLKCTPEFSYNTKNNSSAAALDLQSRIGKQIGITFNGMFADTNFTTADTLTRGYGKTKNEYQAGISYDLLPEIPLQYSQHRYIAKYGSESNYSAHAGINFPRYPFFDVDASRTVLENNVNDTNNVFDSLFHIKDRVSFKLSEISSPYLEHLFRSKKIRYDITHAEYRYQAFETDGFKNGRKTDANLTIVPIQPVTIMGTATYRYGDLGNHITSQMTPSLEFLTFDMPLGADLHGKYTADISKSDGDTTIEKLGREIGLTLKPGRWYKKIGFFSINGSIQNFVKCTFDTNAPAISNMISGLKNVNSSILTKDLGLKVFLNESFFVNNLNTWTDQDAIRKFTSANDFQVLFNSRNEWSSLFNYNTDYSYYNLNGSTIYSYRLTNWLRLSPEIGGTFETDTLGNKTTGIAKLTTSISLNKWLFLKSLLNYQTVSLKWYKMNAKTESNPDFTYTFRLDVLILPNINLTNQEALSYVKGTFDNFTSNIICTIVF